MASEFAKQMDELTAKETTFKTAMDAARQPLASFMQEPRGACDSQNLARASDAVLATLEPAVMTYDNAVNEVAALTLDIADAAADKSCPAQARSLYRYVISIGSAPRSG
jgi:hypothetical protein